MVFHRHLLPVLFRCFPEFPGPHGDLGIGFKVPVKIRKKVFRLGGQGSLLRQHHGEDDPDPGFQSVELLPHLENLVPGRETASGRRDRFAHDHGVGFGDEVGECVVLEEPRCSLRIERFTECRRGRGDFVIDIAEINKKPFPVVELQFLRSAFRVGVHQRGENVPIQDRDGLPEFPGGNPVVGFDGILYGEVILRRRVKFLGRFAQERIVAPSFKK